MKRLKTIFLSSILIIAGLSFLNYWWTLNDIEARVVDVWGVDPFSLGYVYGHECRREIQGICSKLGFVDEIFNLLANVASVQLMISLKDYIPKEYLIEMFGVALGAGVNFNQIFFLNMMPDYMQILEKSAFACSQFIVVNNTNPLTGPIFGRTLDYLGDFVLDRYQVIIRLHTFGNGHTIIGHTIAGMIGYLTGINEEGLSIGVSQISPWDIGLGISCVLAIRDVLQHNETTTQAEQTFRNYIHNTIGGWCFAILDRHGSAAIVEISRLFENTIWKPNNLPFLAITNHFISPKMAPLCTQSAESVARLNALCYLIPQIPLFNLMDAINLVRSHYDSVLGCYYGGPRSLCNHGVDPYHGTMGAFIANPKNRIAVFCLGKPCESDFYIVTFDLIGNLIGPIA